MRVLLWTDMEGMSRITDHRECGPVFEQYWETGRRKFTDEVSAAARGLLQGGADAVYVSNAHGLAWPNILWSELPTGAFAAEDHEWEKGFDAAFFVGFHARAGTADGFISHTMVPGLTVTADDLPMTEVHIWALLEEIPVLGVAGDAALATQLDGLLAGVPFRAVKESSSRQATTPREEDEAGSYGAIADFAAECAATPARPLDLGPFRMEMTVADHGVTAQNVQSFKRDGFPALQAAIGAALVPLLEAQGDLDLSNHEALQRQDPEAVTRFQRFFHDWVSSPV